MTSRLVVAAKAWRTKFDPMKPAPPVTIQVLNRAILGDGVIPKQGDDVSFAGTLPGRA